MLLIVSLKVGGEEVSRKVRGSNNERGRASRDSMTVTKLAIETDATAESRNLLAKILFIPLCQPTNVVIPVIPHSHPSLEGVQWVIFKL